MLTEVGIFLASQSGKGRYYAYKTSWNDCSEQIYENFLLVIY